MTGFLLRLLIGVLGLWLASEIVPGIEVRDGWTLLLAALLLGVVNAVVRPVAVILTLPLTIVTLGLFLLVVNAGMLALVAWMLDGLTVSDFWPALLGSIVISLTGWLASRFIGPRERVEMLRNLPGGDDAMAHPVLGRLLAILYRNIARLTWAALLAFLILHLGIAWLAFLLAGEDKAASLSTFWYFYVVTATTVGYGDVTPATLAGRLITVLWIMPGGIVLFTAVIGKLVQTMSQLWSRRMRGEGDYSDHQGQFVIFGWQPVRTARLVRHLLADDRYDHHGIVLVARDVDTNPLPDQVRFVRAHVLSSADAMARSGVATANVAIVVGADDNETLAVGLAVGALAAPPRIVAYFENDGMAALLRSHCPSAEANVSISVELLARSAQDPGSSEVTRQLLSPLDMPTQFSLLVPPGACRFTYGEALSFFKDRYDANVLAHQDCRDGQIVVNARKEAPVGPGDRLYFVADQRLLPGDIDWTAFESPAPPRGLPAPVAAPPVSGA